MCVKAGARIAGCSANGWWISRNSLPQRALAHSLGEVGARHVILYWRATRDLSDATRYNHWLALRILWWLAGKAQEPPAPRALQVVPEAALEE